MENGSEVARRLAAAVLPAQCDVLRPLASDINDGKYVSQLLLQARRSENGGAGGYGGGRTVRHRGAVIGVQLARASTAAVAVGSTDLEQIALACFAGVSVVLALAAVVGYIWFEG